VPFFLRDIIYGKQEKFEKAGKGKFGILRDFFVFEKIREFFWDEILLGFKKFSLILLLHSIMNIYFCLYIKYLNKDIKCVIRIFHC